jgi:hypothetical protein
MSCRYAFATAAPFSIWRRNSVPMITPSSPGTWASVRTWSAVRTPKPAATTMSGRNERARAMQSASLSLSNRSAPVISADIR